MSQAHNRFQAGYFPYHPQGASGACRDATQVASAPDRDGRHMAPDPPMTCAEFFRAADAAGYTRESARQALNIALRRVLGFDRDPASDSNLANPDLAVSNLVSHVADVDPRFAALFDVWAEETSRHALIGKAWAELTRRPARISMSRR
jgi:hypothetical protein